MALFLNYSLLPALHMPSNMAVSNRCYGRGNIYDVIARPLLLGERPLIARGESIMLQRLPIMLCCTAPKKLLIMLNKCPYYAQILVIKWVI